MTDFKYGVLQWRGCEDPTRGSGKPVEVSSTKGSVTIVVSSTFRILHPTRSFTHSRHWERNGRRNGRRPTWSQERSVVGFLRSPDLRAPVPRSSLHSVMFPVGLVCGTRPGPVVRLVVVPSPSWTTRREVTSDLEGKHPVILRQPRPSRRTSQ